MNKDFSIGLLIVYLFYNFTEMPNNTNNNTAGPKGEVKPTNSKPTVGWVTVNNSTSSSAQRTAIKKGNDFTRLVKVKK